MLRQLAQYHAKNTGHLFMVRIAQGLTHMGKGTLSLSPFHTDRQVMNPVAVSGLLITLFSFLDTRNSKYLFLIIYYFDIFFIKKTLNEVNKIISNIKIYLYILFFCRLVILGKSHYLLYTLVVAMYPRWLVTLDEDLEPLPVSVRVGQVSFFFNCHV